MSVKDMAHTDTHSHGEADSVESVDSLSRWEAGKAERSEIEDLLAQIRVDMTKSVNHRRSLRETRREAAKKCDVPMPDPDSWRRELAALRSKGLTDINIGFWRVSTVSQVSAEGPERQQKAIIAQSIVTTERGVDMWVYDVDSGKEEARVGFDFLLEAIAGGGIGTITVERLDRIARSQWLAETLNRAAFDAKVAVSSATEHIPKGPVGDLLRQVLQAIAQFELALIKSRLRGSKLVKREREGTANGGEMPYGYLAVGKGYMAICEPEARIIRLIFLLYRYGYSQSAIGDALNRWGIPTRLRGKLGWRQGQIRRIVRNEAAYRAEKLFGSAIKNPAKIAHQPILEHRADFTERTYLFGTIPIKRGRVPDDLNLKIAAETVRHSTHHKLSTEQAICLKTMFALRDKGMSIAAVTAELNRLGFVSLTRRRWKWTNVQAYLGRREMYEPAIHAASVCDADVEAYLDPAAHEAKCIERIHLLRASGLSLPKIQDALADEGLRTASGSAWSLSSLHRVCSGKAR